MAFDRVVTWDSAAKKFDPEIESEIDDKISAGGGGSGEYVPLSETNSEPADEPFIYRRLNYVIDTDDQNVIDLFDQNGNRLGYLNEWGALRGTSPYSWGDALVRGIRYDHDTIAGGGFLQLEDRRTGAPHQLLFGVSWQTGAIQRNGVELQMVYTLEAGQDASDVPAGTPAGTLILRKTV